MPEVPADEEVTDPIVASEEEPRESGVVPESPHGMIFFAFSLFVFLCHHLLYIFVFLPADMPQDSDDFEPCMDATFDDASDKFMEAESISLVVEECILW